MNNFWQNKSVFITGHTGFKGSWLSLLLKNLNSKLWGYSLPPDQTPNLYSVANVEKQVKNYYQDLRDFTKLKDALIEADPEIIFHLAAQSLVRKSYKEPLETFAVNTMGTANLLEAARDLKRLKAIVIVTSDKCYENREQIWGYREDDPMGGRDPYSASKGCAELIVSSYTKSFFSDSDTAWVASARAGNVIGGGDWAEDRLVPDCMRAWQKGDKVTIRYLQAVRPWQHVLEPLYGYLVLAEALYLHGEKFSSGWNFGPNDDNLRTVGDLLSVAANLSKGEPGWQGSDETPLHEATLLSLDCTKAKSLLNWQPRWNFTTTIEKVVTWYEAFYKDQALAEKLCSEQINAYLKELA